MTDEQSVQMQVTLGRMLENQEHVRDMLAQYLKNFEAHVQEDKATAQAVQNIERRMSYYSGTITACSALFAIVASYIMKKLFV